jgi:hypothetical protein
MDDDRPTTSTSEGLLSGIVDLLIESGPCWSIQLDKDFADFVFSMTDKYKHLFFWAALRGTIRGLRYSLCTEGAVGACTPFLVMMFEDACSVMVRFQRTHAFTEGLDTLFDRLLAFAKKKTLPTVEDADKAVELSSRISSYYRSFPMCLRQYTATVDSLAKMLTIAFVFLISPVLSLCALCLVFLKHRKCDASATDPPPITGTLATLASAIRGASMERRTDKIADEIRNIYAQSSRHYDIDNGVKAILAKTIDLVTDQMCIVGLCNLLPKIPAPDFSKAALEDAWIAVTTEKVDAVSMWKVACANALETLNMRSRLATLLSQAFHSLQWIPWSTTGFCGGTNRSDSELRGTCA